MMDNQKTPNGPDDPEIFLIEWLQYGAVKSFYVTDFTRDSNYFVSAEGRISTFRKTSKNLLGVYSKKENPEYFV